MGCGASSEGAPAVLPNTVTQNGRSSAHLLPESALLQKGADLLDINLEDQELQEAATKIQAAFRGHQTRSKLKMAQEEEVIDIDLNDPEVGHAATKIQASFRGHKARKEAKKQKDETELSEELEKLKTNKEAEAEELDIDLTDPELNKAATKIQAQFRGHTVRKPVAEGEGKGDGKE